MERDIRGPVKSPVRSKVKNKIRGNPGPLWVPPELKELNKGYFLYWAVTSDRSPYGLMELRQKGYEFVPSSQLKEIADTVGDGSSLVSEYSEGERICVGTGAGTKSYLMRIRQELKDEIDREFEAEVIENQHRIEQDLRENPDIYKHPEHGKKSF